MKKISYDYPEVRGNLIMAKELVDRQMAHSNYRLGVNGECILSCIPFPMLRHLFLTNKILIPSGIIYHTWRGSEMIYKLK